MTPGELFESLADATWHRLADGAELGVRQGETSVTDYLLLEIARLRHPAIRLRKTKQNEEDTQGTDWEWWIGTPWQGWMRYAIQAKRGHVGDGKYDQLGHRVRDELQAEILDRYSTANGATPLYCLYNSVDRRDFRPFWHCKRPMEPEQLGCSIAPFNAIYDALNTRGARHFDWVHTWGDDKKRCLPWRCLLRCPAFIGIFKPGLSPKDHNHYIGGLSEFFGRAPRFYRSLPRGLPFNSDFPAIAELNAEELDPEYYNFDLNLWPRRIAVVDVSQEVDAIARETEAKDKENP